MRRRNASYLDSFLLGVASVVDIFGTLRDPSVEEILSQSDEDALRSDWEAVGDDLRSAMSQIDRDLRR